VALNESETEPCILVENLQAGIGFYAHISCVSFSAYPFKRGGEADVSTVLETITEILMIAHFLTVK
jgi:hypothetical protein